MWTTYSYIFVAFGITCSVAGGEDIQTISRDTYNEDVISLINTTIECIRTHLQNGYEDLGIPSFDPFELDHLKVDPAEFGIPYISGSLELNDFVLSGIPEFFITNFTASGLLTQVIDLTINVDRVIVNTQYIADLTLFDFIDVYGNGEMDVEVNNISIRVQIVAPLIGSVNVTLSLNVEDLQMSATGLLNDNGMSNVIIKTIEDMATEILHDYSEEVNSLLNSVAQSVIGTTSLAELLILLGNIQATCSTTVEHSKQNNP